MPSSPGELHAQANVPYVKYSTAALQSTIMTAAQVAGGEVVVFNNTGTTPGNLQMPLAADIVAVQGSRDYIIEIRNSSGSANTATITTNTGITLTGTMTIAQNTTRRFAVTFASNAITVTSIGLSAAGA